MNRNMKHYYFLNIWKYLLYDIESSAVLIFPFMCKLAPDVSRTREYLSEIRISSVKEDLRCIIFSKISILEPLSLSVSKMFLFLQINLNLPYIQCGQIFFIRKLRRMEENSYRNCFLSVDGLAYFINWLNDWDDRHFKIH